MDLTYYREYWIKRQFLDLSFNIRITTMKSSKAKDRLVFITKDLESYNYWEW